MYKHLGVLCGQKGKWSMLLVVMDKRISIHLPHEVVMCFSGTVPECCRKTLFRHFHSVL